MINKQVNVHENVYFQQQIVHFIYKSNLFFKCKFKLIYLQCIYNYIQIQHNVLQTWKVRKAIKLYNKHIRWQAELMAYPEQPLHPQCTHSTIFPSSSLLLGTLHTHAVPKLVSLGWMQRRQHRFSYPCCKRNRHKCDWTVKQKLQWTTSLWWTKIKFTIIKRPHLLGQISTLKVNS